MARMPLCKTCSKEYTADATIAYEAATGWDNECVDCTRRKFVAYVKTFLMESFTIKELALRVEGYFNLPSGTVNNMADADPLADFIIISVLDQKLGEGGITCTSPGEAITRFVEFFDERVDHLEKVLSRRARRSISRMCIAGVALVGIVAIIILLSAYMGARM
ncbi:MAG: hypothetical protein GYA24_21500 [Candidatus Lokiarchaeota archaeon]|nr:hypothetical protein [Candidatus Lokiarchaeota archaeon]